jgi:Uma2 family endonuclease
MVGVTLGVDVAVDVFFEIAVGYSVHVMIAETAFRSDEHFDQKQFRRWLDTRPAADINHYELIDGRIIMTPPAGWPHGGIEAALVVALGQHVQSRKLGIVLGSSAGYDLPSGDTLEPDVSFIAARRFAAGPKPTPGKFLRIVPNLVVEILSPSTARKDRIEKKVYERNGVDEYWLVDPARKAVTIFYLGKRGYGAGATATAGPLRSRALPGLDLSVKELFTF